MVRSSKKARRLVVGDQTFLWSLGHEHLVDQGQHRHCAEALILRRQGARGLLLIVFGQAPGRLVPYGYVPSGAVGAGDLWLNLHEPGTVRALLDEALALGWSTDDPETRKVDGWPLFDTVVHRPSPSRGRP